MLNRGGGDVDEPVISRHWSVIMNVSYGLFTLSDCNLASLYVSSTTDINGTHLLWISQMMNGFLGPLVRTLTWKDTMPSLNIQAQNHN